MGGPGRTFGFKWGGVITLFLASRAASAGEVYTWDADPNAPGIQGGSGAWNSILSNWQVANGANVPWSNNAGNTAVFGAGPGGTVTLGVARSADAVRVDAAGYVIAATTSTQVLTLTTGAVAAAADVTISARLTATGGLNKTGDGVLTLTSTGNTIGGPVTVLGGAVAFTAEGNLGSTQNDVNLSGGRLRYAGANPLALASGRLVIVGDDGGGVETPAGELRLAGAQLAGTGVLTKSGGGVFMLTGPGAAAGAGFGGSVRVVDGEFRVTNPLALNGRPIELSGGTLTLLGDTRAEYGGVVTVTRDAVVTVDRELNTGMVQDYLGVDGVAVRAGTTLTLAHVPTANYLSTGSLGLDGALRIERSALRVSGAFSGDGPVTFGTAIDVPQAFASGLLFENGAAQTVSNAMTADPSVESRAVVGVGGAGTAVTYQGKWQSGGDASIGNVVLRDGGAFTLGAGARVNTLTADRSLVRPFTVIGTGGGGGAGVFELDAGFVADHTQGGTVADGLGGLEVSGPATLVTRASASLPVVTKADGFGGKHRAGTLAFTGEPGGRWRVTGTDQQFDGNVTFATSAIVDVATKLTHAGGVNSKFDGQFQLLNAGTTLTKEGAGTLVLAGSQGYVPGTTLDVRAGGVRFASDPGQGYYAGNFARGAAGDVEAAPAAAGTLAVVTRGGVEFAAPVSRVASLRVEDGGTARVVGATTLVTRGLDVAGDGQLDVGNGRLVVEDNGIDSLLARVAGLVKEGFNAGGARWQGAGGIVSGVAAANASLGIGYAEAADVLNLTGDQAASFGGATVHATSILVRLTRLGDANLDGVVGFEDLQRLELGYGKPGGWSFGDFNYDGMVDRADLTLWQANRGLALPLGAPPLESGVPEPAGLLWVGVAACAVRRRERKRV